MAEFFSECIRKIAIRLGPNSREVAPVERYLKTQNSRMYIKVLENSFGSTSSVQFKVTKSLPQIKSIMSTLKYFYGCSSFANLGELQIFDADSEKLKDAGLNFPGIFIYFQDLQHIAVACPNLLIFYCNKSTAITDEGIRYIAESCKHLTKINITENNLLSDIGIKCIAGNCPNLEELAVKDNKIISAEGVNAILTNCFKLITIDMSSSSIWTDSELKLVGKSKARVCSIIYGN
jgi:hypothetical protein